MTHESERSYKDLVGHNVLLYPRDEARDDSHIREYYVAAISPDGKLVKFRNGRGNFFWTDVAEYRVRADLGKAE
jgi:hypothetical protein